MSQGETAPEPSMDEILSSIRKIIADDETTATTADTDGDDHPEDAEDDDDILELTEADEDPPVRGRDDADDDEDDPIVDLLDEADAEPPRRTVADAGVEPAPLEDDPDPAQPDPERGSADAAAAMRDMTERLLDGGTASAAAGTLQRLSAAVAPGAAVPGGERTLEAFLADLVRPELKAWLDQHLPTLVERIVEREIRRLVRDAQPE